MLSGNVTAKMLGVLHRGVVERLTKPVAALIGPAQAGMIAAAVSPQCLGAPADMPRPSQYESIFLDAQAWWAPPGQSSFHVHAGLCVPQEPVSGVWGFDVRLIMHNNPGTLRWTQIQVTTATSNTQMAALRLYWTPGPDGTFTRWEHLEFDTSRVPYDGYQEIRVHANVLLPDGKVLLAPTSFQVNFQNDKLERNFRPTPLTYNAAQGWYTGYGYTMAMFQTPLSVLQQVPANWAFNVRIAPASSGHAITHHVVAIDADGHADPPIPGTIAHEGAGQYVGTVTVATGLLPGLHRLLIRGDAADAGGMVSSVLVLPFIA